MGQGSAIRRGLIVGLAIAAAGVTYSYVSARGFKSRPASYVTARALASEPARATVRPVSEIVNTVREMGLAPTSEVLRRGPYYVLHALNTYGVELRVVADAHFGDILSVRPAQPYSTEPDYVRAPRIIHVPQPGDAGKKGDDAAHQPAPSPHSAVKPPPTDALLTPIRPTPKFGARSETAEKSGPPQGAPPPVGGTPPTAAPNER